MRRFQHVTIAVAVVALLAACGDDGSADRNSTSPTSASAGAAAAGNASSGSAAVGRYDPNRDAAADIKAALAAAAADQRPVLVDFGSDWCEDCKALSTMFATAEVAALLRDKYHLVVVDVGNFDRNVELAGRYVNLQTSGIPALVVLNPDGSVRVATNDGAFAEAKSMKAEQVVAFLNQWAGAKKS